MKKEVKSRVLIVDDIQSNVEFLTDILSSLENIEIQGTYDGQAALDSIKINKPDLILLDVSMPLLDGFEVCETLKSDPRYSDIPIIFLTARVQNEDIVHGFELGAVDYIAKPFNLNELISRVETHLELRSKSKALQEMNLHLEEMVKERTAQLTEANRELSEANKKLSTMYDELSALDHAKDDFIAHINHELRTPLNGILAYTSLLEDGLEPDSRKSLNSINDLVSRLIGVSEIALLLTELRSKDNKINIHQTVLEDTIRKAIPEERAKHKNIQIDYLGIKPEIEVMAEQQLLAKCITIILDNAIKYSPLNSTISLNLGDNDQYYTLEIQDEGPGFSSDSLANIFELFTADNLDHRSYGFGLGLATAKKIIDLLGGKITINNSQNGALVVLHLQKA